MGMTYFSPEGIAGEAGRNYLRDVELLKAVENVIVVLTPDYLDGFLTDDVEPNRIAPRQARQGGILQRRICRPEHSVSQPAHTSLA